MYCYIDIMKLAARRKKPPKCVRSVKDHSHLWRHLTISVVFQSLSCVQLCWPHGLQHPWPPGPSPSPRVCSNSCPLSRWCHPTISSSVALFSSCPPSFPASGSFPMTWLFTSGRQSIGVSSSASVKSQDRPEARPFATNSWSSCECKGKVLKGNQKWSSSEHKHDKKAKLIIKVKW